MGYVTHPHLFPHARAVACAQAPTFAQIDALDADAGEFIVADGVPYVKATHVDKNTTYFSCPWCFTRYTKSGIPTKRARRVVHRHGRSEPGFHHRGAHCVANRDTSRPVQAFPLYYVVVTPTTPKK